MTDEMRVALVAVAMAAGLAVDEAWEVVDGLGDQPDGSPRALTAAVAAAADRILYPVGG